MTIQNINSFNSYYNHLFIISAKNTKKLDQTIVILMETSRINPQVSKEKRLHSLSSQ